MAGRAAIPAGTTIESYSFGRMVIDGREYRSDLIIYPDGRIQDTWRRRAGHRLCLEDIAALTKAEPDVIVVGTGATGLMRVDCEVEQQLADRGMELHVARTAEAVGLYNRLSRMGKTGACFHLTC